MKSLFSAFPSPPKLSQIQIIPPGISSLILILNSQGAEIPGEIIFALLQLSMVEQVYVTFSSGVMMDA
jgi:hypothetical protein